MILRDQPTDPWTEHDFLLLEALQILKAETCNQCGLPRWQCHSEDPQVDIRIVEDVCFAKRRLDADAEVRSKATNYKPKPGVTERPEAYKYDGSEFTWEDRQKYHEELAKQRAELAAA